MNPIANLVALVACLISAVALAYVGSPVLAFAALVIGYVVVS